MRILFLLTILAALCTACGGETGSESPCDGVTCSGHGVCSLQAGNAVCLCENGYRSEGLECVDDRLAVGEVCEQDADCSSEVCVDGFLVFDQDKLCRAGELGDPCIDPDDCTEGVCAQHEADRLPTRHCMSEDQTCASDADCPGAFCLESEPVAGTCEDGLNDSRCFGDEDCVSGNCIFFMEDGHGAQRCSDGRLGDRCDEDSDCVEGECEGVCQTPPEPCVDDGDCASGMCWSWAPGQGFCTEGEDGSQCEDGGDCLSGICATVIFPGGVGTMCVGGQAGDPCAEDAHCIQGTCIVKVSAAGVERVCSQGEAGQPCGQDADCISGTCQDDYTCE